MCVPLPHEQDTNSADTAYGIACLTILEFCDPGTRDPDYPPRRSSSKIKLANYYERRRRAGQGGVSRKLGLCVACGLRALPCLVAELPTVRRSTCPRSTT